MRLEWTDDRVTFLTDKWGANWTSTAIAADLGITRNSVIGKLKRLDLLGSGPESKRTKPGRNEVKLFNALNAAKILCLPLIEKNGNGISLFQLTNTTCRWPISPGYSCGANEADLSSNRPYCLEHTQIAKRTA